MLTYPTNAVGYDEFIWSCFFQDIYYTDDTIDETTMAAVEAVRALPSLEEINALIAAVDQESAAARAEEITELLKTARTLYNNIVSETQLAFFNGEFDGTDYLAELSAREMAMRPVKDHYGILTTVVSITLISTPDKMTYYAGEEIDTTGMVIEATYDDGTTAIVEDYELSTYVASVTGGRITVSYGGKTTSFRITVKAAEEKPEPPEESESESESSEESESIVDSSETPSAAGKKNGCKGVGIGLGIGIPVVALGAVAIFVMLKKKKGGK